MNSPQRFFALALTSVLVIGVAAPAAADFAGGRQAEANRDYKTAAELYRQSADEGDARSLTNLGVLYAKGRGVTRSYEKAIALYRKAARQGQSTAQYNIGLAYRRGRGVERDDRIAAEWFQKSAGKRHAGAQYNLGLLHRSGRGVEKNVSRAFQLFREAADRGHAGAQYYVGLAYRGGIGVKTNLTMATQWFRLAAKKRHVKAFYRLGRTMKPAAAHLSIWWNRSSGTCLPPSMRSSKRTPVHASLIHWQRDASKPWSISSPKKKFRRLKNWQRRGYAPNGPAEPNARLHSDPSRSPSVIPGVPVSADRERRFQNAPSLWPLRYLRICGRTRPKLK